MEYSFIGMALMFLCVCAGLSNRLEEAFDRTAAWEDECGRSIACILQLGDLPLGHDFTERRPSNSRPATADFIHGRRMPRYPVLFLAGELDDFELISTLVRKRPFPSRAPDLSPQESQSFLLTQDDRVLRYLFSSEIVQIVQGMEAVSVAGCSHFGEVPDSPDGWQSETSRRARTRQLLAQPPGTVPLIISHDTPEPLLGSNGKGSEVAMCTTRSHPGAFFLRAVDLLQPRAAFHGHAVGTVAIRRRGPTTLVSLPPWPRTGPAGPMGVVDTSTWEVEIVPGEK